MTAWIGFVLMLMANAVTGGLEGKRAGPIDVVVKSIQQCPDDLKNLNTLRFTDIKLSVYNRTTKTVSGNVEIDEELSDNCTFSLMFSQLTNTGVKKNYFNQNVGPLCTGLHDFAPQTLETLFARFNISECPISPPINYYMDDFPLVIDVSQVPSFFYGTFYVDVPIVCHEEIVGCIRFLIDLVPKSKRRG